MIWPIFHLQEKHLVSLLTVDLKNPILVTLLNVRPHYSQSSRENATPSSGTFPLASCKEVPRPRASQTLLTDVNYVWAQAITNQAPSDNVDN